MKFIEIFIKCSVSSHILGARGVKIKLFWQQLPQKECHLLVQCYQALQN